MTSVVNEYSPPTKLQQQQRRGGGGSPKKSKEESDQHNDDDKQARGDSSTTHIPNQYATPFRRRGGGGNFRGGRISVGRSIAEKTLLSSIISRCSYPLLYVSPCGTISVICRNEIFVEMTVDKTIRVLCPGKFSAASNARGNSSCIMHPKARIYQSDTHVYCELEGEKLAVFGSQGIIFTMKRLPDSYLVSSTTVKGTSPISSQCISYPTLRTDYTMNLLYAQSECGSSFVRRCNEIVRNAKYKVHEDGTLAVTINGILIKQHLNGDISVHNHPRCIKASPTREVVFVRTHFVDMGVQDDDKAFVKRGVKRIHSSRSGMVVSDGPCITAMDHYGRIVSST